MCTWVAYATTCMSLSYTHLLHLPFPSLAPLPPFDTPTQEARNLPATQSAVDSNNTSKSTVAMQSLHAYVVPVSADGLHTEQPVALAALRSLQVAPKYASRVVDTMSLYASSTDVWFKSSLLVPLCGADEDVDVGIAMSDDTVVFAVQVGVA